MEITKMTCPNCQTTMQRIKEEKEICFRGTNICVPCERFVCPTCGLETGTLEQTAAIQKNLSDAYRQKMDLLTSDEIVAGRKKLKLSQKELAEHMNIGIASIKRWEGSIIQSKSMDKMLREALAGRICGDPYTGNKSFSIPRVHLVMRCFETVLGKIILKKNDKMLFAAKYLWYADMVAFRELAEGITGATYAALPYGPQMNNYKDLIDSIRMVGDATAEPLTDAEKRIIEKIARVFPQEKMVYDATHRERVWEEKSIGALIPYTDAVRLTEI